MSMALNVTRTCQCRGIAIRRNEIKLCWIIATGSLQEQTGFAHFEINVYFPFISQVADRSGRAV
jgi:hypothetical protein